jgi:hypothetical protein
MTTRSVSGLLNLKYCAMFGCKHPICPSWRLDKSSVYGISHQFGEEDDVAIEGRGKEKP